MLNKLRGIKSIHSVITDLTQRGVSDHDANSYEEIVIVALKAERTLEVYGRKTTGPSTLITTFPFTGFSGETGPKLREGDKQIPEGLYRVEALNPNSSYHLSIKLNYPNAFDQQMGKQDGRESLGSDIFIHGKTATIGCIPIGDPAIEELFLIVNRIGITQVKIIIAPCDFRQGLPYPEIDKINWETELYSQIHHALLNLQGE
ncbi:L,D-transpeptidase family protein [Kiritimatiellota bacterium B12222]|nr:L,D-transpeptidase family protein [Kiritimatiellota bacterium B12222]